MSENEAVKEERRFQLRLLEVQQGNDIVSSVIVVVASVFVALITTSLTLVSSLPSSVIGISASLIIWEIIVAFIAIVASWCITLIFRDRRIRQIESEFKLNKTQQNKP